MEENKPVQDVKEKSSATKADQMERAQEEAAEERKEQGGYQ